MNAARAKVLADEFFPEFSVEDLVNLPDDHIDVRLTIDGVGSQGFSAATLSPHAAPAIGASA